MGDPRGGVGQDGLITQVPSGRPMTAGLRPGHRRPAAADPGYEKNA